MLLRVCVCPRALLLLLLPDSRGHRSLSLSLAARLPLSLLSSACVRLQEQDSKHRQRSSCNDLLGLVICAEIRDCLET